MQTWAEGHDGEEVILWMSSKGFPHNHQEHIFRRVGCLSGCVCLCGCVDARESLFDANNKKGIQSEFKLLPMNLSASRQRFRTKTNPNNGDRIDAHVSMYTCCQERVSPWTPDSLGAGGGDGGHYGNQIRKISLNRGEWN